MSEEHDRSNVVFEWGKRKLGAAGSSAVLLAFGLTLAVLVVVVIRETRTSFWGETHQQAFEKKMAILQELKTGHIFREKEHDRLAEALTQIAEALRKLTISVERTAHLQALTVQFLHCQVRASTILDDKARGDFYRTSQLCQPALARSPKDQED